MVSSKYCVVIASKRYMFAVESITFLPAVLPLCKPAHATFPFGLDYLRSTREVTMSLQSLTLINDGPCADHSYHSDPPDESLH